MPRFLRVLALLCALSVFIDDARLHAFGLSSTSTYFQVDTGAGLVFRVRRTDNGSNTQSAGDIMSLVWNGVEYQNQSRGSQVTSGFDYLYTGVSAVSVSAATVGNDFIKVTVSAGDLTHYYMARRGLPHIYMGTHFSTQPDIHGLVRYIFRIPQHLLPNGPAPSDIRQTTSTIESGDIFALPNGQSRSKHYSNMRLKDWAHIGATGPNVGLWMLRDDHEGGSGGPFYRSLLNQCGDDQEITYIVNYGQAQTEAFRPGILNTYTTVFTTGGPPPATVDTSWFAQMGLLGFLPPSGRGGVRGTAIANRDTAFDYTVGLANSTAQYWADADPVTGAFLREDVRPGDYTLTVYKNELAVHTASVSVAAGVITELPAITLAADPARTAPLWRVGAWDGTPLELSNGPLVTTMHPSDPRLATWTPGTFVVGQSDPATAFPCYQWTAVNGSQTIQFQLAAGQQVASTVRVGITVAYANARPRITVNNWTSSIPAISTQPGTRTLTTGSYRGNNTTYTFSVPASALVVGTNTLTLSPVSGSGGTGFLSAGYSLDCVDFFQGAATTRELPAAVSGLAVVRPPSVRRADLSWSVVAGAAGYRITRATTPSGPWTVLAANHAATTYTDAAVADASVFHYRVAANNSTGSGPFATASIALDIPPRPAAALVWTAAESALWDGAALNWREQAGAAPDFFLDGDQVRFDDSAPATSVTLVGTLRPAATVVDTAAAYAFSGAGALSGSGTLQKSGAGTLTLNNVNSLAGATTVSAGTLALGGGAALGASEVTLLSGAAFRLAGAGTTFVGSPLRLPAGASATLSSAALGNGYGGAVAGPAGSTLTLSGPVSFNVSGSAQLAAFAGVLEIPAGSQLRFSSTSGANGNGGANTHFVVHGLLNTRNASGAGGVVLGALSGSGRVEGQTNTTAGTVTYLVGGKGLDTTFSGVIANGANGAAALTKLGSGALTLTGAHTYTGATTVNAGSLVLVGSLGSGPVSVAAGAAFGGGGGLGGNLTLASGSTLLLGVAPGSTRGPAVGGAATLNGTITVSPRLLGASLAPGVYPILTYNGALAGSPTLLWSDPTGSGLVASFDHAQPGELRVVLRTPLQVWRQTWFDTADPTGPAADTADPDGDGLPNLLEYALGTDPLAADAPHLISLTPSSLHSLSLTFFRARAELTYRVEASSDLVVWTVLSTNPGVVGDEVTVTDTQALSSSPRRFLRLHVSH